MKRKIEEMLLAIVLITFSILSAGTAVQAQSLYEEYTIATKENLEKESREMGRELTRLFNHKDINVRQQDIDASEYVSNLKKMIIYASKLSTYSEYDQDLSFARDKEVFKGLPETREETSAGEGQKERKVFIGKKYKRMKQNAEDEIATYVDLMVLSLDTCEILSQNDFSGFLERESTRNRINGLMTGKNYQAYEAKKARFTQGWPDLAERLAVQLALWQSAPSSPNDPILDPEIVGAL
ncbi:hypothetical protein [Desulfosarcina ovata]|uniref:Uncharacterized protein n=1 Tax=Desulfosarcina ovata subsp. ovata TaxID=2752305 RepID=A0A5K8AK46_9BACT|nr:hypothetical protein [Desulfosarcina ovata]BBO92958.1 hypothetical protein DSCOOX_61380 [Desulfosarcina ovata subsp. ovata]